MSEFPAKFYFINTLFGIMLLLSNACIAASHDNPNDPGFDDQPLKEDIVLPDWFKMSFLELKDDISDARENGKKGLIIYFGQKRCPYCKAMLENDWGQKDIINYTQKNFDVIAINIRGQKPVVDLNGKSWTERSYSVAQKTNFTPSLIFYDLQGREALRLRGYRPPYQFRAALEYAADAHYLEETFKHYLARAEKAFRYGKDGLNENDFFLPPPYMLDRSHIKAERPLLVSYERPRCHACDILHGGPLNDPRIRKLLGKFEVVQLDMSTDTPLVTPTGKKTTTRQWAQTMNLDYAPTLIFFDERGREIIRIDSVVWFYRLQNVLIYVDSKAYRKQPNFQIWRQQQRR
ncbi:thioredoxin SoxW [hydrothermal vent metagenome]|uniref:Thioredoxin SoxW n=1 Tax=hydrothermal vent metagenome TaxID=652676 RepID=A0A3B1C073_9ZZZZ